VKLRWAQSGRGGLLLLAIGGAILLLPAVAELVRVQ
jgi:hypothetical protein